MKATVTIIESERGWGQRIDEVRQFKSMDKAWEFYKKFNAEQPKYDYVPDNYYRALEPQPVAT